MAKTADKNTIDKDEYPYTFPDESRQDLSALRVVVRAGMSHDMADLFLDAVRKQTASLESLTTTLPPRSDDEISAFKH